MRLPYLRAAAPAVIATAKAQRWDPAEVLRVLINEEVIGRDAATRRLRRKTANFPTGKTLATWRPAVSTCTRMVEASTRVAPSVRQVVISVNKPFAYTSVNVVRRMCPHVRPTRPERTIR